MPDSNTVGMYVSYSFACFFFLLAIYVKLEQQIPFSGEHISEKEEDKFFRGFMVLSSISIIISMWIALKKKDNITTKEKIQSSVVAVSVLATLVASWSDCNVFVVGATTLCGILSVYSIDN